MFFKRAFESYTRLQSKSPYTTNFFTGGFLGASGDVICQNLFAETPDTKFDFRRLFAMTVFGQVPP
jgi:hypothetical protein